ncbi:hypothetical protein Tco_0114253 [Tanacetum coccineum]
MIVQAPKEVGEGGSTKPITDEPTNEEHVSTPSYDQSQSGEDRMQLKELMDLCAKLSNRVLALKNTNTSQAAEITTLKKRVKKLEKKRRSKTYKPIRLYKVGLSRRIEPSDDASLGAQEDASKQGRKIADLDANTEPIVSAADPVTTASVEIPEELTLAQTLIEIKSAKSKAVTTAAVGPALDRSLRLLRL